MQALQLPGLDAYLAHLRQDPDEAGNLFRDLLIGVTGFFRDPDAFAALAGHVVPSLFEGRGPDETVRVWVPGCATGEEAYSLAILLREEMGKRPDGPRAQVFATDIGRGGARGGARRPLPRPHAVGRLAGAARALLRGTTGPPTRVQGAARPGRLLVRTA